MPVRLRQLVGRLLLVGGAIGLTLALAEGALRLAGYNYTPLAIETRQELAERSRVARGDARGYHAFEDESFTYDPRLIWRPRPGRSVFNAQGYRGPELAAKKAPGEVRVLAVGDSNTLGWAGADGANWPGYLGELFAETDPRIRVVNAGVWGYTVFQGERRLEEALALEPDVVLVSFGSNDAHPVSLPDREFARLSRGALPAALSRLKLVQALFAFADRRTGPEAPAAATATAARTHRVPLAEYREALDRIVEMGDRRGFDRVFLTRPYLGGSTDPGSWKTFAPGYREATVEAAAAAGVPLVDLYEEFRERSAFFADESHFTALGHRLAAKRVYDAVAPLVAERAGLDPARLLPPGPGHPDRLAIDFTVAAAREHLAFGFSARRKKAGGVAIRSRGHGSTLRFLLDPADSDYRLEIAAGVARGPEPLAVEVAVNGEGAGSLALGKQTARHELEVPRPLLTEGLNWIELFYEGARPHADEAARATNPIVRFESLSLAPARGAAGPRER